MFFVFGLKKKKQNRGITKNVEVIVEDRSLLGAARGRRGTSRGTVPLPLPAPISICANGWRRRDPGKRRPGMERKSWLGPFWRDDSKWEGPRTLKGDFHTKEEGCVPSLPDPCLE